MTAEAPEPAGIAADDSRLGLAMFVIFAGAILIVTGAVALLALVGSWWMLGFAVAVHAGMTVIVTVTIVQSMSGQTITVNRVDADRSEAQSAPAVDRAEVRSPRAPVAAHL